MVMIVCEGCRKFDSASRFNMEEKLHRMNRQIDDAWTSSDSKISFWLPVRVSGHVLKPTIEPWGLVHDKLVKSKSPGKILTTRRYKLNAHDERVHDWTRGIKKE